MDAWIKFSNLDNSWVDSYLALSCLSSLLCCSFNVWISKSRSNFSFSRSCFLRFSLCRFSSNIRLLTSCSTRALILVWKKSQWNKGSFTKTHRHLTFNIFASNKNIYPIPRCRVYIFIMRIIICQVPVKKLSLREICHTNSHYSWKTHKSLHALLFHWLPQCKQKQKWFGSMLQW